jgi:tetratricopeptide (TPR) repeat protein
MDRGVIETVFVSGRLGHAIYRADDQLFTMPLGGKPHKAVSSDLQDILVRGAEFQVLHKRTLEEIQAELEKVVGYYNALFLVLSLLDYEVALSTKLVAAQAAEELLLRSDTNNFVYQRLLSFPLPLPTRSRRHQLVSPWSDFGQLKSLLSEVFESQPILDELWAAWKKILDTQGVEPSQVSAIEATLISAGLFYDAVCAINAGDRHRLNSAFVKYATNQEILSEIGQSRTLLTSLRSVLHERFFPSTPKAFQKMLKFDKRDPLRLVNPARGEDRISELIDGIGVGSEKRVRHTGALEAKARVDKQITAIKEQLLVGKDAIAEKYLQELIEFQLGQGDRVHAAMSLCNLTSIAMEADQFEMADRLSLYALKLTSNDDVVYTIRAEVLKQRGHFDAAIKAYEEAMVRFGEYRYAINGLADVFKEKGLYDEALKLYNKAKNDFPEDSVAFNGEVSVLKAKGEQRAALALALKHVKKFEFDAVTRATLAGCLVSVGKYEDALRHYSVATKLDSSNARIQINYLSCLRENGDAAAALHHLEVLLTKSPKQYSFLGMKALLLRSLGRLDEAESVYRELVKIYPTYIPAKTGIAVIRVLQKRAEEARQYSSDQNSESEQDWFSFRVHALSYATAGDYRRASPRLVSGIERCPWTRERAKLATALAFVELSRGDLDRSIGVLNKGLDLLDSRDQQIRFVLLGHAHAQRGAKDVACSFLGRRFRSKERTLSLTRRAIIQEFNLPIEAPKASSPSEGDLKTYEFAMAMAA